MIIPEENILNVKKLKSLISKYNIDFFDFGCSHGEGLLWTQNITGTYGFGFDIDSNKLESANRKDILCTSFDILKIPEEKLVSFTTIFHLLEHLESTKQAKDFILKACHVSRQNIYLRQPFFDADPWLFHKGLKTYYSHWTGHKNLMTTPVLYYILNDMLTRGIIKNFIIAYKELIESSNSEMIHPLSSPIDSLRYDKANHPPKPAKIVFNEIPIYFEIIACIDIDGGGYGKLWPKFKPDKIVFDSSLRSVKDQIKKSIYF